MPTLTEPSIAETTVIVTIALISGTELYKLAVHDPLRSHLTAMQLAAAISMEIMARYPVETLTK